MKNWKKIKKKVCAGITSVIMAIALLGNVPMANVEVKAATEVGAYGVGQGKKIPDHIFAPFVDIVSWTSDAEYASAGSLSLKKMYQDTGILYYNLGFIMTDTTNSEITNGVLNWCWGGYSSLNEKSTDQWQLNGIKESIRYIRSVGGDVIISVGGLNEGNFFQATQDEEVLYNTYMDLIQGYGLTRLDLDIEGNAQVKNINIPNARALKRVQDETGVEIVLTLPVLPSGLTNLGMGVLEAYLENDVDVKMVNIMSMCYGSGTLLAGENYGTASLRAVNSLAAQLKSAYNDIQGVSLSDEEIYSKIGTTVSIGYESGAHPIWTTEWSQLVVDQAKELNIGMASFWCLNRDCMQYGENSGIHGMYEHTNIFKTFMQGDNEYVKPEDGAENEKEPGKDDETGNSGDTEVSIDEWTEGGVYVQGDQVVYNGKIWEAQWWTQGTVPGTTEESGASVWKYIKDVKAEEDTESGNEDNTGEDTESGNEGNTGADTESGNEGSAGTDTETGNENDGESDDDSKVEDEMQTGTYPTWASGVTYAIGDLVSYNNKVYECISAHTSHDGWLPNQADTLWQERNDLVNVPSDSDEENQEGTGGGNQEGTQEGTDGGNQEGTGEGNQEGTGGGSQGGTGGGSQEGTGEGNQEGTGGGSQEGTGGGNQEGTGEGNQEGIGGGSQEGTGEGNQEGTGGGSQEGTGEGNQEGTGGGSQGGTGEGSQEGTGGGNQEGTGEGNQEGTDEENQEGTQNDSGKQEDDIGKTDSAPIGTKFISGKFRYVITSNTSSLTIQLVNPIKKTYSKLTIPSTVKYKGKKYKVTSIGKDAFKNNTKLKSVIIGKNVVTIKKNAFYGCKKMTSVTIGANVKVIESKAFYKCQKLSKVIFKGTKLKQVGSKAFVKTHSKLKIKVKNKKTISKYKKLLKKKVPAKTKITK